MGVARSPSPPGCCLASRQAPVQHPRQGIRLHRSGRRFGRLAVLASRLSENPNITLLLLEAGESDTKLEIHVPLAYLDMQLSEVDWAEQTLGGSSSINDMILYTRGNREDFDRWVELGAEGWSYQEILQYFIKSEDFIGTGGESEFRGTGGPLTVSHATQYRTRAARSFVEGVRELGYPEVDYNGRSQLGVSFGQFTIRDGRRWSTAQAFLWQKYDDITVELTPLIRTLSFAPIMPVLGRVCCIIYI